MHCCNVQATRIELALANATLVNLTAASHPHLWKAAVVSPLMQHTVLISAGAPFYLLSMQADTACPPCMGLSQGSRQTSQGMSAVGECGAPGHHHRGGV